MTSGNKFSAANVAAIAFALLFAVLACTSVMPTTALAYDFEPYTFEPYTFEPYTFEPYAFEPYTFEPYTFEPYNFEPYTFEPYSYEPYDYCSFGCYDNYTYDNYCDYCYTDYTGAMYYPSSSYSRPSYTSYPSYYSSYPSYSQPQQLPHINVSTGVPQTTSNNTNNNSLQGGDTTVRVNNDLDNRNYNDNTLWSSNTNNNSNNNVSSSSSNSSSNSIASNTNNIHINNNVSATAVATAPILSSLVSATPAPIASTVQTITYHSQPIAQQTTYVAPTYTHVPPPIVHPAPYCTISISSYGYGYGGQATLTWNAGNATSATINPSIGSVPLSGSRVVYPGAGHVYTMNVWGPGGSASCQTQVAYVPPPLYTTPTVYTPAPIYNPAPMYTAPVAPAPFVSLTQIPYTGFDYGPIGNTLYWFSLASIAIAGAYLLVYYRGGFFGFVRASRTMPSPRLKEFEPVMPTLSPIQIAKTASASRGDSMSFVKGVSGLPQIVISRS